MIGLQAKSKWVVPTESDNNQNTDTILTYLADPVIKSAAVKEAGGYKIGFVHSLQHHVNMKGNSFSNFFLHIYFCVK
jgi:hypothetical protein